MSIELARPDTVCKDTICGEQYRRTSSDLVYPILYKLSEIICLSFA
jgi:hypothetical protein